MQPDKQPPMKMSSMTLERLWRKLPKHLRRPDPNIYNSDNYIVLDFEVTNHDYGSPYNPQNRPLLNGWLLGPEHPGKGQRDTCSRVEDSHNGSTGDLFSDIERADFLVAHNAKFELGWLERLGLSVRQILVWDTQIAEYVWLGNRKAPLDLDSVAKRHNLGGKFSAIKALMASGICPSEMPQGWLREYAHQDVRLTHDLFLRQRERLRDEGLLPVFFTRCIFTPVLGELERLGMHLDKERVLSLYREYIAAHDLLSERWDSITGGINPRSSKQKSEFFYDKVGFDIPSDYKGSPILTDGGEPTTRLTDLISLKPKNNSQREVLELIQEIAKVNAALDKNLSSMKTCVEADGLIHFNFNQTVTGTHRLSSNGRDYKMQGQNLPREFKPLFRSRFEGYLMGEIDQAQLEYRVAVFLGQDAAGLRSILDRVDRHQRTAEIIFGTDPSQPNYKELRTRAKAHTFKPLYGGSSGSRAERQYYEAFKREHQGITRTQDEWINTVLRTSCLRIPSGLIFYFPGTHTTSSGYVVNSSSICNYPVQSFATADIVPISVTYLWALMIAAEMKSFLVNTVHDSVVAEIHPDEVELFKELGVYSFTRAVYGYLKRVYNVEFNVPLEAEVSIHTHWGDKD